jgi:hypothetical protein
MTLRASSLAAAILLIGWLPGSEDADLLFKVLKLYDECLTLNGLDPQDKETEPKLREQCQVWAKYTALGGNEPPPMNDTARKKWVPEGE